MVAGGKAIEGCVCCLLPLLFDMAISIIHETYIHMYLLRGKSTFGLWRDKIITKIKGNRDDGWTATATLAVVPLDCRRAEMQLVQISLFGWNRQPPG